MREFVVEDLENVVPDSPEAYGLSLADLERTGKTLEERDTSNPEFDGAQVYHIKGFKGEFIMLELSSHLKDSGWVLLGLARKNYKGKSYVLTVGTYSPWPAVEDISLADLEPTGDRIVEYQDNEWYMYHEVYRSKDPADESIYLSPLRGAEKIGGSDWCYITKWVTLEEALERFDNSACVPAGTASADQETSSIVAWVNGEAVYEEELREQEAEVKRQTGGKPLDDEALFNKTLDQLVVRKVLLQEAKRRGISVSPEEVSRRIETMKQSFPGMYEKIDLDSTTLAKRTREWLIFQKLRADVIAEMDEQLEDEHVHGEESPEQAQDRAFQAWVQGMKQKAVVKRNPDFVWPRETARVSLGNGNRGFPARCLKRQKQRNHGKEGCSEKGFALESRTDEE